MTRVVATYRLQIRPSFDLDAAAGLVDYLEALGVSHLYASPLLQATPGSTHGYDVVDPTRIDADRGGEAALGRLAARLSEAGMGLVVDLVPNHLAASRHNPWWWDVLEHGPGSGHAAVFDVDWEDGQVVLPVLAEDDPDLRLVEEEGRTLVASHDRRFPVREGTGEGSLEEVLAAQHYRLAGWRSGTPNYRRFFDITGLVGVRMEDPAVFAATHDTILRLVDEGVVDGLRIDHPDGLRDPAGYLRRLRREVGADTWVVVEKILEPGETLRATWPVDGTVGYEFCRLVTGLLVDPAGEASFTALWDRLSPRGSRDPGLEVRTAKRLVVGEVLAPEWERLSRRLAGVTGASPGQAARVLRELLAAFPVYRTYVRDHAGPQDRRVIAEAVAAAEAALWDPDAVGLLDRVRAMLTGEARPAGSEVLALLQQTTGPIMAKGKEDTAFYRYLRFPALNEVGGDPATFGIAPAVFHAAGRRRAQRWPGAMLTTSTHDTKRSEDVRARLAVLSEIPDRWVRTVRSWEEACEPLVGAEGPDGATRYLAWHTAVGAWPISGQRLSAYLVKAAREAKRRTSWRDPDQGLEDDLDRFAHGLVAHEPFLGPLEDLLEVVVPAGRINSLTQTLLRLTSPGVPDLYQGQELWDLSLVDPDNRRPVDFDRRRRLLAALPDGPDPDRVLGAMDEGLPKLWVVREGLHVRRTLPTDASHVPLRARGEKADHVVAHARGGVVAAVAPRLTLALGPRFGRWRWGGTALELPEGRWRDRFSGRCLEGGWVRMDPLLSRFPVALLVRL